MGYRRQKECVDSAALAMGMITAALSCILLTAGPFAEEPAQPACADCHDVSTAMKGSIHEEAGVECVSCHNSLAGIGALPHPKPDPVDCSGCHDAPTDAAHPPGCVDCHGTHSIEKSAGGDPAHVATHLSTMCGACHEEIVSEFTKGIHGRELLKGNPDVPTCLTCHGGHRILHRSDPNSPVNGAALAHTCAGCHDNDEISRKYGLPPARLETFLGTYHGLAQEYGDRAAASCSTCHGAHRILPSSDPASTIHPANLAATCGACHLQAGRNFAIGKIHLRDTWEDNPFTWVARRFYQGMIASMMGIFGVFMVADFVHRRRVRSRRASGPGGRP